MVWPALFSNEAARAAGIDPSWDLDEVSLHALPLQSDDQAVG